MVGAILGMRIGHEVVGADDECLAFCGTQIPKISVFQVLTQCNV
jgi:hypothetical protein